MYAGHLADGAMVKADNAHPKGIGQWLSLSFVSLDQKEIAGARLQVEGIRPNGHATQAFSGGISPYQAVQTLDVAFSAGPNHAALANIWVPGMSAVNRIELISMDYGDGSNWKIGSGASCHVAPDPMMLITSR